VPNRAADCIAPFLHQAGPLAPPPLETGALAAAFPNAQNLEKALLARRFLGHAHTAAARGLCGGRGRGVRRGKYQGYNALEGEVLGFWPQGRPNRLSAVQ
tara:strand:- start:3985 stop:4284 length:300 start_codon:yes stop_codon:yes gene_type:complete